MKIILDARKIHDYGIGVYLHHLFEGLINCGQFDHKIIYYGADNPLQADPQVIIRSKSANYNWFEQLEIPIKTRSFKDYYYFSPHYVFPLFIKNHLLVAIHDLIHFKFPHFFKPAAKVSIAKHFIKVARKRAAMVFTGSQTAKEDLCEMFGFKEEQIEVIHHGISDQFFSQLKSTSPYAFPYIIYSGNNKPHKNLTLLLDAFTLIVNRFPELHLILLGFQPQPEMLKQVAALQLQERVIFPGFVPITEQIRIVDGSEFFVFPSQYEGFGLPPLEAMARQKAVISSTGGSLPEVLGENALFFDPRSSDDLSAKIMMFLNDTTLRLDHAEKGRNHARSFRWEKTINRYIKILNQIEQ